MGIYIGSNGKNGCKAFNTDKGSRQLLKIRKVCQGTLSDAANIMKNP